MRNIHYDTWSLRWNAAIYAGMPPFIRLWFRSTSNYAVVKLFLNELVVLRVRARCDGFERIPVDSIAYQLLPPRYTPERSCCGTPKSVSGHCKLYLITIVAIYIYKFNILCLQTQAWYAGSMDSMSSVGSTMPTSNGNNVCNVSLNTRRAIFSSRHLIT